MTCEKAVSDSTISVAKESQVRISENDVLVEQTRPAPVPTMHVPARVLKNTTSRSGKQPLRRSSSASHTRSATLQHRRAEEHKVAAHPIERRSADGPSRAEAVRPLTESRAEGSRRKALPDPRHPLRHDMDEEKIDRFMADFMHETAASGAQEPSSQRIGSAPHGTVVTLKGQNAGHADEDEVQPRRALGGMTQSQRTSATHAPFQDAAAFGIYGDEDWFSVEEVRDSIIRDEEEFFLVDWTPTHAPSDLIQSDPEDIEFVQVDGRKHKVASWKPLEGDAYASTCVVYWERTWEPIVNLKRAGEAIRAFRERKRTGSPAMSPPTAKDTLEVLVFEPELNVDYRVALRDCILRCEGPLSAFPGHWPADRDKRPLVFRPGRRRIDAQNYYARRAIFSYLVGVRQSNPCDCCVNGGGPFVECVVNPLQFSGACTNWSQHWRQLRQVQLSSSQ